MGLIQSKLSVSELASHIGYIAQNPDNQIFNMTVWDEVSFALKNLKFSERGNRKKDGRKSHFDGIIGI